MLRVAVVEDNPDFTSQILGYIDDYQKDTGMEFYVREFPGAFSFFGSDTTAWDIVLLDIEMPGMNGMEVAAKIREQDEGTVIVFITNMAQYAIKGYEVNALDFILKPLNYQTFSTRFTRAIKRVPYRGRKKITLNTSNEVISLPVDEILYVESKDRFLHYHTASGTYSIRDTMRHAEEELGEYNFIRCNYWYLVNLEKVDRIRDNVVELNGYELVISRRNKVAFREAFSAYLQRSK